jgi:hypothetical protein
MLNTAKLEFYLLWHAYEIDLMEMATGLTE